MNNTIYRCLCVFVTCVLASQLKAQTNSDGVVISRDSSDAPHSSAILDIRSNNELDNSNGRGVKLPSYGYEASEANISTYQTTIDYLNNKLSETPEGLTFYMKGQSVSDQGRGIYYYDAKKNSGTWLKLRTEGDNAMTLPDGSIIMYLGKIDSLFDETGKGIKGTEAQGWVICNGRNGSPDLRERFLVCQDFNKGNNRPDDDYLGSKGNSSSTYTLKEENIEEHNHVINPVNASSMHTHDISIYAHQHDMKSEKGRVNSGSDRFGRKTIKKENTRHTENSKFNVEETQKMTIDKSRDVKINYPGPNKTWVKVGAEGNEIVDNRPDYMVVIYIMKNEKNLDFNPNSVNYVGIKN